MPFSIPLALAIYLVIWFIVLFAVLPVRRHLAARSGQDMVKGARSRRARRAAAARQGDLDDSDFGRGVRRPRRFRSFRGKLTVNWRRAARGGRPLVDGAVRIRLVDGLSWGERVAQLVEHLTFNQRVMGSSPIALTNEIKELP